MLRPIPIGFDDFRDLRERGLEYVDKSHLIRELIDRPGVQVAWLLRPRRFGKTLNLSMLRYYFEKQKEDPWPLFADLSIVASLLEKAGLTALLEPVRGYYNGYVFGGEAIYNPWSILSLLASDDRLLRPYWLSTSGNDLVRELLAHHASAVEDDIETLFEGGSIERRLEENAALSELKDREDSLWSLLVFSGYLKAEAGIGASPIEEPPYRLSIPNREVRQVYSTTFRNWMEERVEGQGTGLRALTTALLSGDAPALEQVSALGKRTSMPHALARDTPILPIVSSLPS